MGWEEFKPAPKYVPPHEHQTPSLPLRGSPPGVGSIWACKCGKKWEVKRASGYTIPGNALMNWRYGASTYYLSPVKEMKGCFT